MNLQTFKASTMAEALGQVKHVMGHDAVILHTRTYHTRYMLGLRRRGRKPGPRRAAAQRPQQQQALEQPVFPPRALVAASAQPTIVRDPVANGRSILEQPAAGTAVMLNLTQEMTTLKGMVKTLHNEVRHTHAPQVPDE